MREQSLSQPDSGAVDLQRVEATQKTPNVCPACNREFDKNRKHQVYCSPKCRHEGWLNRKLDAMLQSRNNAA